MYIGLQLKYWSFLSNFNETWISTTDFWKILKYKISWKSVSGSWVVPCRQMDRLDEANAVLQMHLKITNWLTESGQDFGKTTMSWKQ
jgi:hypothetical protein